MTELLLRTPLDDQQRRYASIARQSGETLCCLINDILDFSKVEAGKLELESVEFDLQNVLDCVLTTLEAAAKAKGLALGGAVHPQTPRRFVGDPGRLQQILLNLAGNAIKFTDHGRVFIRAVLEEETHTASVIRFTVDDTGIGIPADRTDRLFKLFSQVDASTTRKYGGTGLGLAISSRLVGLMGGQIGVSSEPGLGSTFWFTLQLARAEGPSPVFGAMACDLRTLRVLVVEDDAAGATMLMQQLTSCDITAMACSTSDSALRALKVAADRGDPFSVALIGLRNPGAGEELAAAIQAEPALSDTVLIPSAPDSATDAAIPSAPDVDENAPPSARPEDSSNPVAPAFNMDDLKRRWGGDPQFAESLIVHFCEQIGGELAHLERHLEEQQAVEFTRYAHGIKGAASYVCAEGVRASAAALEQLGIAGRLQDAGELLAALRSEIQRCMEAVTQGVSA